jgi:hypothetical protein
MFIRILIARKHRSDVKSQRACFRKLETVFARRVRRSKTLRNFPGSNASSSGTRRQTILVFEPESGAGPMHKAKQDDWLAAAAKRSHAVEGLPDTIIEAVRSAKMDERHNHLNKLMDTD